MKIPQVERLQRAGGPAGDGETQLASVICCMNLSGHPRGLAGSGPP